MLLRSCLPGALASQPASQTDRQTDRKTASSCQARQMAASVSMELKMSELMARARSVGVPQDQLDELMDMDSPKLAIVNMLNSQTKRLQAVMRSNTTEHRVQELVDTVLERGADTGKALAAMASMCESSGPPTEPG